MKLTPHFEYYWFFERTITQLQKILPNDLNYNRLELLRVNNLPKLLVAYVNLNGNRNNPSVIISDKFRSITISSRFKDLATGLKLKLFLWVHVFLQCFRIV